jgi:hypothetical protein
MWSASPQKIVKVTCNESETQRRDLLKIIKVVAETGLELCVFYTPHDPFPNLALAHQKLGQLHSSRKPGWVISQ